MSKMYEGAWGYDHKGALCGPARRVEDDGLPWEMPDPTFHLIPWHVDDDGGVPGADFAFVELYPSREDALKGRPHPAIRLLRKFTSWLKRFAPHDKQQAFLFGVVVGLCVAVFLVACDNPASPDKPCTKQEIHGEDTVEVPCVMRGGLGEP